MSVALDASSSFSMFGLNPILETAVSALGFTTPTPIQDAAIPVALKGGDVVGLAQTGTGKTAAFVLPMVNRLLQSKVKGARALVLVPTRELADQVNELVVAVTRNTHIRSLTLYGGVSYNRQFDGLRGKPQIIVACPGRLLDHIQNRAVDLSGIEMLVLDEADRMFDMGFLPTIRKIIREVPAQRQTMLFSATMPREVEDVARAVLTNPVTVKVKSETPVAAISHACYRIEESKKSQLLDFWLTNNPDSLVVIFTRMKHTAKRLAEKLIKAGKSATSLHGNLSQNRRNEAIAGFKNGEYSILVATDIAARGIDVEGVTHVLNYDMPDTLENYIHRIGRSGRASRTGDAVSFVTSEDAPLIRSVEKWLKQDVSHLEAKGLSLMPGERPSRTNDSPAGSAGRGGFRRGGGNGRRHNGQGGGRQERSESRSSTSPRPESRNGRPARPGGNRGRFRRGSDSPAPRAY